MAIPLYNPREDYVGLGNLADYTFDFKIADLDHILIRVTDASFNLVFLGRGGDSTYLSSVDFDPVNGGGTVHLKAYLPTGYFLTLLLANDQPLQSSEFKDKGSFTLKRIEDGLDAVLGAVQRLAYRAARSFQLSDSLVDTDFFDPSLPIYSTDPLVANNADRVLAVGDDNASIKLGPTTASIASNGALAAASAAAALASQISATASATAAAVSAAAAATSATSATTQAASATNSATNAATSANNASTSATNAATSAAAALASQTSATASAASATTSATTATTQANNAATSATAAAASATTATTQATSATASAAAAAASAASVASPAITGTRAAPSNIIAGTGIAFTGVAYENLWYLQGNAGNVTVSANPRIAAGTNNGQKLRLMGRNDAQTVTLADGNGLATGGQTLQLGANTVTDWVWDTSVWVLCSSNGLI